MVGILFHSFFLSSCKKKPIFQITGAFLTIALTMAVFTHSTMPSSRYNNWDLHSLMLTFESELGTAASASGCVKVGIINIACNSTCNITKKVIAISVPKELFYIVIRYSHS